MMGITESVLEEVFHNSNVSHGKKYEIYKDLLNKNSNLRWSLFIPTSVYLLLLPFIIRNSIFNMNFLADEVKFPIFIIAAIFLAALHIAVVSYTFTRIEKREESLYKKIDKLLI